MSNLTLIGWRNSAATLLVQKLPLQTFSDSLLLVDAYLASVGGWISDDENDSTGVGLPANGATPAVAVSDLVQAQTKRVYRLTGNMDINVDLNFITNLSPDQTDEDVLSQMKPLIEAFVQKQLQDSPLAFSSLGNVTGTIVVDGVQTPAQRATLYSNIFGGQTLRDPRVVALIAARKLYGLEDNWNVSAVYTEQNKSIVVIIRRYTETTVFDTLDTATNTQYVISINPSNYKVTGGIVSPVTL